MSITRYRGLMVLVLWQTVPNPVAVDSTGRIQGVLGFGSGQYEKVRTDCNSGDVVNTSPNKFRGGGVQIDAWPTRSWRVTGFGGSINADSSEFDGPYVGGLVALELQRIGVGIGAGGVLEEGGGLPAAYLRLGNRDGLHARFDMAAASPPYGMNGNARIGVGYHLGHLRGLGGYGGLAVCTAKCQEEGKPALFADLRIPVGSMLDVELRALGGGGHEFSNTGIAVGGRLHFSR